VQALPPRLQKLAVVRVCVRVFARVCPISTLSFLHRLIPLSIYERGACHMSLTCHTLPPSRHMSFTCRMSLTRHMSFTSSHASRWAGQYDGGNSENLNLLWDEDARDDTVGTKSEASNPKPQTPNRKPPTTNRKPQTLNPTPNRPPPPLQVRC